jgi:hypothetical protein
MEWKVEHVYLDFNQGFNTVLDRTLSSKFISEAEPLFETSFDMILRHTLLQEGSKLAIIWRHVYCYGQNIECV